MSKPNLTALPKAERSIAQVYLQSPVNFTGIGLIESNLQVTKGWNMQLTGFGLEIEKDGKQYFVPLTQVKAVVYT